MEWGQTPIYFLIMHLHINGKPREVSAATVTAEDLLAELDIKRERVAVVINENVVRRAELGNTRLSENDTVEIITMVGGG